MDAVARGFVRVILESISSGKISGCSTSSWSRRVSCEISRLRKDYCFALGQGQCMLTFRIGLVVGLKIKWWKGSLAELQGELERMKSMDAVAWGFVKVIQVSISSWKISGCSTSSWSCEISRLRKEYCFSLGQGQCMRTFRTEIYCYSTCPGLPTLGPKVSKSSTRAQTGIWWKILRQSVTGGAFELKRSEEVILSQFLRIVFQYVQGMQNDIMTHSILTTISSWMRISQGVYGIYLKN